MHIKELRLENVCNILETRESTPRETVKLIEYITTRQLKAVAMNPPENKTWTQKLAEVRDQGYKPWQVDDKLGFDLQKLLDDGIYAKYKDPLNTVAFRLDVRIHHALALEQGLRQGGQAPDWLKFLIPAVTSVDGLFDFMNVGRFALLQEEPASLQVFEIIPFTDAVDDLCLDMHQPEFDLGAALRKYSTAYHRFVSKPLGFKVHPVY